MMNKLRVCIYDMKSLLHETQEQVSLDTGRVDHAPSHRQHQIRVMRIHAATDTAQSDARVDGQVPANLCQCVIQQIKKV